MNAYDCIRPYKPEEWERNYIWLTNRAIFLINLKYRNMERFYGGDAQTPEEWKENQKNSFEPELEELEKRYKKQYLFALDTFFENMLENKIVYMKEK